MESSSPTSTLGSKTKTDLHTHSSYSDGLLTPSELVAAANQAGVGTLALTDHDTLAGLNEATAAATAAGIELIPGLELSAEHSRNEVHVLGYFVDPADSQLAGSLAELAEQRISRNRRIVEKLDALGFPVSFERVLEIAGAGTVGRPHIAQAMIEQGYVQSISEAFERLLASGRLAFVPRLRSLPEDAVRLLTAAKAVAVLAHPLTTGDVEGILQRLVPLGLAGMEVHYGEYDEATRLQLARTAADWNLIPTGGSDYHGPDYKEGRELGSVSVPRASVDRLLALWHGLQERPGGRES